MRRAKSREEIHPLRRSHSHLLPGPGTGPHLLHPQLESHKQPNAVPHRVHDSFQLRPATTWPSEPIFFPKLQIHFADFPYLHASSGREAVHLGDLLRIWVRLGTKITLSLGFSRTDTCAPGHRKNRDALRTPSPYRRVIRFQGACAL